MDAAAHHDDREQLARDRTRLANERTLLAYVRTALALFITGASAIHLPTLNIDAAFDTSTYYTLGGILVLASLVVPILGYRRYRQVSSVIRQHEP